MYTLHHGFWIYFFTRHHPQVWQFVFGAMLPDYIYGVLFVLLLGKGFITWSELGSITPGIMMSFVPIFPWVERIDLIGHSVPVWVCALAASFFPGIKRIQPIIIGWGTHLLIDALTHGAFANFYLFPLGTDTIESPVSYWEPSHWSQEYKLIHTGLMAAAAAYLLWEWWQSRKRIRK
jgi:hypothetical protein